MLDVTARELSDVSMADPKILEWAQRRLSGP